MVTTKRVISLLFCCLFLINLISCGKKNDSAGSDTRSSADSSQTALEETENGETETTVDRETNGNVIRSAGSNTNTTTSSANKTGSTTKATSVQIKADSQEEKFKNLKGTLRFVSDKSNVYEDQIIAEFESRYNVKVEVTTMGWSSFTSQLSSMVATGKAPDVACMTDATFLSWCYGNLAQPLNKYLDFNSSTWNKKDMEHFMIGSNYYGVPTYEYNGFMIYYNKTLFKEQKVSDPYNDYYLKGEWTFENFRKVAKAMTIKKGDTVTTWGFATWYFPVFVLAAGGSIIKQQNNTYVSDLQNPATITGINMIRSLYMDGSYMDNVSGFAEFGSRGVAMVAERPINLIGNFDYYNTMKDEIGVVPFPKVDKNSKEYAPALMTAYFVPNKAKNPLAGVAWMYYNIRRAIDGETSGNTLVLAQRRRAVSDEHKKIFDQYFSRVPKVTTKLEGLTGWGNQLRGQFWGDIFTESPSNSKTAEEAIAGMEAILKTQLKLTIGG